VGAWGRSQQAQPTKRLHDIEQQGEDRRGRKADDEKRQAEPGPLLGRQPVLAGEQRGAAGQDESKHEGRQPTGQADPPSQS
jgi:hypothetical protein